MIFLSCPFPFSLTYATLIQEHMLINTFSIHDVRLLMVVEIDNLQSNLIAILLY
jgi:hypothetical protein